MTSRLREVRFPLYSRCHTALSGAGFEHDGPQRRTRRHRSGEADRVPAEHVAQARRREGKASPWRRVSARCSTLAESDLRAQHLSLDVTRMSENAYGVVYEIEGPIKTPSGKTVRFCSIWQIDAGTDVPRFITMYPR